MTRPIHKAIIKGWTRALCGAKERTLNYDYLLYTLKNGEVSCSKCKAAVKKNLN